MNLIKIPQKRHDIQFLRGVSFLLVLLFHLQVVGFQSGFLGVDIFFVVSGFLMAFLYMDASPSRFFKSRIKRLLPAYFFTNVLFLAIGTFLVTPLEFIQLQNQVVSSAVFGNNFYFWNLASYFEKSYFNPLLNLWSLGVEIQFYLFFPLLALIWKKSKHFISFVSIASFLLCLLIVTVSPKTSFYMMPTRFWEFYLGILSAHFFMHKENFSSVNNESFLSLFLFALLIIFILFFPLAPSTQSLLFSHPSLGSLIVCSMTALILYFGISNNFFENLIGKLFVKLGDVSYSAYLVHFPIIIFYNYSPFGGTDMGYTSTYDLIILLLLITFTTAILYTFFERNNFLEKKTYVLAFLISIFMISAPFILKEINKRIFEADKHTFAAAADKGVYRCGKVFRLLNPFKKICYLDNFKGTQNVLILGNSYADAIKTRFLELSRKNDIGVKFAVPNPPILDDQLPIDELIDEINIDLPDMIIIHFSNIYENSGYASKLEIAIGKLHKLGIPIHILPPVPAHNKSVPQLVYEGYEEHFLQTAKEYDEYLVPFSAFISILNKKGIKTHTHNLEDLFCKLEYCKILDENSYPIYYDSHHLNIQGSSILDPVFYEIISNLQTASNH